MAEKVSSIKWFGLAVQALLVLADHDQLCPSGMLAEQIGYRSAFLRKILTNLVKAGLIQAKEGRDGGYSLAKDPAEISLADVYFAMRAEPFSTGFLEVNHRVECFPPKTLNALCNLKNEMEDWLIEGLSKKSIADLLSQK